MAAALSESVDVVVVGAGISGLSAAYELMKKRPKTRFVVLEAKGKPHQITEGSVLNPKYSVNWLSCGLICAGDCYMMTHFANGGRKQVFFQVPLSPCVVHGGKGVRPAMGHPHLR